MTSRDRLTCGLLVAALPLLGGPQPSVGIQGFVDIDAPFPDVRALPADEGATTVVRIVSSAPLPDGGTRYRIAYTGFEPGEHDLAARLALPDGTPLTNLVFVAGTRSVLAPGVGFAPDEPPMRPPPRLGGYRAAWVLAAGVWLTGWIVYAWRKRPRRVRVAPTPVVEPPPSPAERLRVLLSVDPRHLGVGQRAELERLVLASWRAWAGLERLTVEESLAVLRARSESGTALAALDAWLHRRDPVAPAVAALLPPSPVPAASPEPTA